MSGYLTDKGWDVTVDDDDGWAVSAAIPEAQSSAYARDYEDCAKGFGHDKPVITPEIAGYAYEGNVRLTKCVAARGYSTPDVPSREKYVDALMNGVDTWDPYALVPPDSLNATVRACQREG